jgi:uncharacterized protein YdeI (YjbR/CyaY-like superfamily)
MSPLSTPDPVFFSSPAELRGWLEANHETATELWVGMYKKGTGKPSVAWPQLVDECLCFGWIDGIRKGLDEESFVQRITPRKARSNWSRVNLKRVEELIAEGRMRPAGLRAYEGRVKTDGYSYEQRDNPVLDKESLRLFQADAEAWAYFQSRPPGYRRLALFWIVSAKREETRRKRLATLIEDSRNHRTLAGLTSPGRSSKK